MGQVVYRAAEEVAVAVGEEAVMAVPPGQAYAGKSVSGHGEDR